MKIKEFKYGKYSYEYYLVLQDRKTVALTVQPSLNIILKCPLDYDIDKIERFLKRKWLWLEKQIQYFKKYKKKIEKKEYVSGESFLYLGRQYKLLVKSSKKSEVRLENGAITIFTTSSTQDKNANKKLLDNWFDNRIKAIFSSRLNEMLKKFDYDFVPTLITRKMPKRWGSYLGKNKIVLNPLLIRASKDCIDYVIVHELCHMKHTKHNNSFFKLQESIIPNWKDVKEKLELRFL
ncbi:M48 family peptidase [Candidatus Peregrinibacteria bacterium CG10_big_fil_rev_8_21_14_0_10_36_19]|nr:MAG: M48 family peptidase [Candidatus Peregrinibacteria bacterium CG10_big_fil_rev_8_21_14_0_10_36_19]